jgi:hypothetical protein
MHSCHSDRIIREGKSQLRVCMNLNVTSGLAQSQPIAIHADNLLDGCGARFL